MALGALPGQALRAVTARIVTCALAGLAVGIVVAMALVRLIQALLYGIGAHDFVSFAGAALVVAVVAVIATWIPARRATRIDPTEALRAE